jgi:hypothetical protein
MGEKRRSENGPDRGVSRRHVLLSMSAAPLCLLGPAVASGEEAAPAAPAKAGLPERPWAAVERNPLPPGRPDVDYTPVVTPNGSTLPYRLIDGVKVFHLTAEPIRQEVAPGLHIQTWGFNGTTPGPTIEVCQGDRVRIYVTNRLPAPTSVHWHGVTLPNGMDGVAGLTQPAILPGQTFRYEFTFPYSGTFMYHPHFDSMTQEGMGLTGMIVVHEREPDRSKRPDRDFCIMLHEWAIEGGTSRPNTIEMTDFSILTMNGHSLPGTEPLVAKLGDHVRIRFGNLSAMDHHPIHLHGYHFMITGTTGGWIPPAAQQTATTVLVQVGEVKVVELLADNPGDWLMHCHMTHHTMNQMGHNVPNMVGVDTTGLDEKIRRLLPGYMTMGEAGMRDMTKMGMPLPENSIPMLGGSFQFGNTVMGGMATVLKVREGITSYADPGWYDFPPATRARPATREELSSDGITSA